MPHDPEAFADMVVMTVKAAMAPVLADVKSLQTQIGGWEARWNDLGTLRERVAVVEAKASTPLPVSAPADVDLTPVLERLSSAEALLKAQGDLRDRVLVVETKAAAPVVAAIADRIDLAPMLDLLSKVEMRLEMRAGEIAPIKDTLLDATKEIAALRERVAVVEVRPPVPGPPGADGAPGKDGANGQDGSPGLSFEGVYQEGQSYIKGQIATWAGSCWHANTETTSKPGESKDWTLMVKRGRDGRDGRDASSATPVVTVGGR